MTWTATPLVRLDVVDNTTGKVTTHIEDTIDGGQAVAVGGAGQRYPLTLAIGDNDIDTPGGCKGAVVRFLSGAPTSVKLKGAAGDTGVILATALPTVPLFLPVVQTSGLHLNVDAAVDVEILFF